MYGIHPWLALLKSILIISIYFFCTFLLSLFYYICKYLVCLSNWEFTINVLDTHSKTLPTKWGVLSSLLWSVVLDKIMWWCIIFWILYATGTKQRNIEEKLAKLSQKCKTWKFKIQYETDGFSYLWTFLLYPIILFRFC